MSDGEQKPLSQGRINLALMHLNKGCDYYEKGELSAAEYEFLCAAKFRSSEAQVNLGNLYSSDELGSPNIKKAIQFYKKAILRRSPQAASNLAITYKELGKFHLYVFWMKR